MQILDSYPANPYGLLTAKSLLMLRDYNRFANGAYIIQSWQRSAAQPLTGANSMTPEFQACSLFDQTTPSSRDIYGDAQRAYGELLVKQCEGYDKARKAA